MRLLVFQSVWAMDGLPGVDLETRPEEALARIVAAGFDGAGVNIVRKRRAEATARVMAEHGLGWEAQALVHNADELARHIEAAHALGGAHHFNVQIAAGPETLREALALIDSLETVAATAPMPVFYETHRGRLTNDLYFTGRILDARPQLKLTGDLSHYVNAHEMALPVDPDIERRMQRVIGACHAFHARVAGPNQVQIGLAARQNQGWLETFQRWWADGMAQWRGRAGPDDALAVMCELGPPPYAMVDAEGHEFSDRWQDALALKTMFREMWSA